MCTVARAAVHPCGARFPASGNKGPNSSVAIYPIIFSTSLKLVSRYMVGFLFCSVDPYVLLLNSGMAL